MKTKHQI